MSESTAPSAEDVVMASIGNYFNATLSRLPLDRKDALREAFFAGAKMASKALGREDCVQALEAQCDELAKTFGDRAFARTSLPREEPVERSEPTIEDWYKTSTVRAELEKLGPAYVELWDRLEGERGERQAQEQRARAGRRAINPVLRVPRA